MSRDNRETVVFAFDNDEQRKEMFALINPFMPIDKTGLRVVALSMDNEVTRVGLMYEATERYGDRDEIRDAIEALYQTDDVSSWDWAIFESGGAKDKTEVGG